MHLTLNGTAIKLGRTTDIAPNAWNISDPRVSREHVILTGGGAPMATAVGLHPIVLFKQGHRVVLQRGESAELEAGMELHLVNEASTPAAGASLAWKGRTCGYRVETDAILGELRFDPIGELVDGRAEALLTLDTDELAELQLGRSCAQATNSWGITDPRISREHALITGGAHEPLKVFATGTNPCVLVRQGAQRILLRRGSSAALVTVPLSRIRTHNAQSKPLASPLAKWVRLTTNLSISKVLAG